MWPFTIFTGLLSAIQALSLQLKQTETRIMAKLDTFFTALEQHFDRQGTALAGISGDVAWLKEQIEDLVAQATNLTPEQEARAAAIIERITTTSESLEALDAMTPPKPPSP